jgi:signal transduction histidine kinase
MVILIVGYRRRRNFERVLFFLALGLFLYYSGILLREHIFLYYQREIPWATVLFSQILIFVGKAFVPSLLIHAHHAYRKALPGRHENCWFAGPTMLSYVFSLFLVTRIIFLSMRYPMAGIPGSDDIFTSAFYVWLAVVLAICAGYQFSFSRGARELASRRLHKFLLAYFGVIGLAALYFGLSIPKMLGLINPPPSFFRQSLALIFAYQWIIPSAILVYAAVRHNFLGFSSQRNLMYAVSGAFLALLYLTVVRKASDWLEPVLPPEATWSILLFVLVGFFEPLQRLANRLLRKTFREQVEIVQRLSAGLQKEAQAGDVTKLLNFAEDWIRKEFRLEKVQIHLNGRELNESPASPPPMMPPSWAGQPVRLPLGKPMKKDRSWSDIGELEVTPTGSAISGETMAALEILAEQLPAIIELCRTIDEKLRLERELAERERMALVGQMTASISHNLKNPLGSMKTVLQVQLENEDLPLATRKDLAIVLIEVDRLNHKLTELLRYARPTVRAPRAAQRVEVSAVAEQALALLRIEAQERGGWLDLADESKGAAVQGNEEALADIFSNLVVNAIEATPKDCTVSVRLKRDGAEIVIEVTDDGPGVSAENRARLFQPFFTTKPRGTGLGLAIVERRVIEFGGTVMCESPVLNGRGARFVVRLPVAQEK